jgi:4-diphosphocytidyl-2C-methyl-D-erythritol kinase
MVLQDDLFNDLEPAAFSLEPRLADLHSALDGLQGRRVRMTGSGSCFFTLFDDRKDAEEWRGDAINRAPPPIRIEVVSTIGGSVI